jgi:ferritin
MAAWAEAHDYSGSATWLRSQSAEEGEHARLFMDHVLDRGGEVTLAALDAPPNEFEDLLEVFSAALEHERKVTASIGDLYAAATDARAYPSLPLLTWFLEEQVEEEASVGTIVGELSKVIADPSAVLLLDRELSQRRGKEGDGED